MKIEIKQFGGTYRWLLKSRNGRVTATSSPYNTKWHCVEGAMKVRKSYPIVDTVKDRRKRGKNTTNTN